jgi:hypothetical protein
MNRILIAVAALSFALPLAAQPAAQTPAHMSRQELHTLMQNAHESAQYKQLADYFRQQEASYRSQAAEEKTEWDRRAQASLGTESLKRPNPADSAHRLYDSYSYEADHSGSLAQHYEELAAAQSKS